MPTITGRRRLPSGEGSATGTWRVRIRTVGHVAVNPDGTVRGGVEQAYDAGTGATMTLPVGGYQAAWHGDTVNPDSGRSDNIGWFPFDLTEDTTWGELMDEPVEVPVTPRSVVEAQDAADRAEAAAQRAEAIAGPLVELTDNGDGSLTVTAIAGATVVDNNDGSLTLTV